MDSPSWDQRYSDSDLVWSATSNQWVVEVAADLPAGRVLDLAGGEGRNSLWLAEHGWRASVVDFSVVALERAIALARQRLTPEAADRVETLRADLSTCAGCVTGRMRPRSDPWVSAIRDLGPQTLWDPRPYAPAACAA